MEKNFVSTMRKGFHMTFENGLTASVQWGVNNYCDNDSFSYEKDTSSNTAEIAVLNKFGEFLNPQDFFSYDIHGDGEVAGYMTPDQVVEFLVAVKDWREYR